MAHGIGIDIGAEMVKVVQLRTGPREVQVLGAASFSRRSLGAEDSDPDALARAAAARAAQLGLRRGPALAGLSGKEVTLRYLRAPPERLRDLLNDEVRQATGAEPSEFACASRPLDVPQPSADESLFVTAVSRSQLLESRSAAFAAGGLALEGFCPASVALFNVFQRSVEAEPRSAAVLLDVGAEKTHVVVLRNQAFVFAGTVMHGGREFTEAVAESLGVDAERAEEIKCRRGAVLSPREIRDDMTEDARFYQALLGVATRLSGAVQSTLSYARAQTELRELEPTCYYLAGGGARLDGLREHLASVLGKPVRWLDLGGWLAGAQAVAEPPSPYGVALGLALAAADPTAFALRLLPERMQRRRQFWSRGVFALAAAAMVLLAVVASLLGTLRERRRSREALAALRTAIGKARDAEARIERQRRRFEDTRRKANLLADQARGNFLLLRTLDALRHAASEAIAITSLTFATAPARDSPPGEEPARVAFLIKGVATQRGAADAGGGAAAFDSPLRGLDAFVRRLRGAPILASPLRQRGRSPVSTPLRGPGTPTGNRVDFEITFSPSDALIAQEQPDAPVAGR
jgi:Tfp pilus assembly PilM family ATPase